MRINLFVHYYLQLIQIKILAATLLAAAIGITSGCYFIRERE